MDATIRRGKDKTIQDRAKSGILGLDNLMEGGFLGELVTRLWEVQDQGRQLLEFNFYTKAQVFMAKMEYM